MDKSIRDFLNLIKESIHKDYKGVEYDYSETDWDSVVKMATETGMIGIVFKRLKELSLDDEYLKSVVSSFGTVVLRRGIAEIKKKECLKKVVSAARVENVPIAVFKGVVISELYPESAMRFSSDSDFYIDESERNRMVEVLLKLGYLFDKEDSNDDVIKYYLSNQHYIELHSKLWSYHRGAKVRILEKMKLTDKRRHGVYDGVECDIIDYGEQMVFLMFHLCKHLICEHASIRFLSDIMLFFYAHYDEMDLELLKNRLLSLDYWSFFSLLYEISVRYLGFERLQAMEDLNPEEYHEENAEATIIELTLTNRDDFDNQYLCQFVYNMMPYLMGEYEEVELLSKNGKRLAYLFPSVKNFPKEFGYVQKCPILLPVGWIHRIIKYSFDVTFKKGERMRGTVRMSKVDERVKRLKRIGLVK
ncbi:MAG: nucleotidyltransferase family protein [Lachnospiraceae bacterium]|nr:nucleotidyltransferase family protein [Lachnospiraceae bacterium]